MFPADAPTERLMLTDAERAHAERMIEHARDAIIRAVPDLPPRLRALTESTEPVIVRIRKLQNLADRVNKASAPYAACKRKCSHCCHMATELSVEEAELIGRAIKRKPETPRRWMRTLDDRLHVPIGKQNPCTFLKNNECSIYEHRPLACRVHISMAPTADPCIMDRPRETACINLAMFDQTYVRIIHRRATANLADIREFFPPN
jgi:uncharacterized protein